MSSLRAALLGGAAAVVSAQPAGDRIAAMPGWSDPLRSAQYSGYLAGAGAGSRIHYYYVASEGGAAADPVVLWLNGGPPCSSLIGAFLEQGPLLMAGDGTLSENAGRWSAHAHMLFLESPPGVGFSYRAGAPPYAYDDNTTTAESHAALRSFFAAFPALAGRDLWISGESYGGVYVPMLAASVLADPAGIAPLKGILVGNGAIATGDWYEGGLVQQRARHAYQHGLVSDALWASVGQACGANWTTRSPACDALLSDLAAGMGPLNNYNIQQTCAPGSAQQTGLFTGAHANGMLSTGVDPCSVADAALTAWMNTDAVRAALHVEAAQAVVGVWAECAGGGNVAYTRLPQDETKTVYPGLLQRIAVLIYNGDNDECIPYLQDEAWTRGMNFAVKAPWRPWFVDQQVAGYVTEYDAPVRFTFATVKEAGHTVPASQPERALAMLMRFISGQPF